MTKWIYESPDNGDTVTRRPTMSLDDIDKELQIHKHHWMDLRTLRAIGKQYYHEREMREKHPQLMEVWESYQTLIKLLQDGGSHVDL